MDVVIVTVGRALRVISPADDLGVTEDELRETFSRRLTL